MIPDRSKAESLWDTYDVPVRKRNHLSLVADMAMALADAAANRKIGIRKSLLLAGALLHDIDKNVRKLPGEKHPDAAVRILKDEGMDEVAELIATHPLHTILESDKAPVTPEEKLLYIADKSVKDEIITVEERFRLWREENIPRKVRDILELCYPKVKELEREVSQLCGMSVSDIAQVAKTGKKSTI